MPQIFDNIDLDFHPALNQALEVAYRADFCVGYLNLRGWRTISEKFQLWAGDIDSRCRVIIGMERLEDDQLRRALTTSTDVEGIDNATAAQLRRQTALAFRDQLTIGVPSARDEEGLRQLSCQLRTGQVVVKLFLRHLLHAKLYLTYRRDLQYPRVAYLGSSNLTFTGLKLQGELNVDVVDVDATAKLENWFNDRWNDRFCVDISAELADIIDQSWAGTKLVSPYHVYLKMAYHLSQDARSGLIEFAIPSDLRNRLAPFQSAAVRIAAHHLNRRGGVLIGDVVGLGKTLMASAVARVFQEDAGTDVLVICPVHLETMWNEYLDDCRLIGRVLPLSRVLSELPALRRYRLVIIDESQNLRNREGRRYGVITDYIAKNESRVIELSATPYNKSYLDLAAQLRLFIPPDRDVGVRPERLIRELGEREFLGRYQCGLRTVLAFEKSPHAEDWRDLMRLYLVRRTRKFIRDNYATIDRANGREYIEFESGDRYYFPIREPRTVRVAAGAGETDPYTRLYDREIVDAINDLRLPRYGLGSYELAAPERAPTASERETLRRLSRGGRRLVGFSRTQLFKRLESGGVAFIRSIERHLLRNFVALHAIEHGLPLPVGAQTAEVLDAQIADVDTEDVMVVSEDDLEVVSDADEPWSLGLATEDEYRSFASDLYASYTGKRRRTFRWISPAYFGPSLAEDLIRDCRALLEVVRRCGRWDPSSDIKLNRLEHLLRAEHPAEKVLVFTQYADTAAYLHAELRKRGHADVFMVTGQTKQPTELAWRFSPISNRKHYSADAEIRVLIATDVLSEGQNLQDCSIVVNYDLPWAIVKLIQRAGRVDRIGQRAEAIRCYSFVPADGVERIIGLRRRVRARLRENAEVVGADEAFFEDDSEPDRMLDLYHERAGVLDEEADGEVDLASFAYQIWQNATEHAPDLAAAVKALPDVVYATRAEVRTDSSTPGVLLYLRTADGYDSLSWIDGHGASVTESQLTILKAAACGPETLAQTPRSDHHELVRAAMERLAQAERSTGGQLGRPSSPRYRAYERLQRYARTTEGTLFAPVDLGAVIDDLYRRPLQLTADEALNRQLRGGISDEDLAVLCINLRTDGRLTLVDGERSAETARIICSLGLKSLDVPT